MAIWQYNLFVVPKEEIDSFFKNSTHITEKDLNGINWWKYNQSLADKFNCFVNWLNRKKSWSEDIILYGSEEKTCIEITMERSEVVEITIRIDFTSAYFPFLDFLCSFAQENKLFFLDNDLKVVFPDSTFIEKEIEIVKRLRKL